MTRIDRRRLVQLSGAGALMAGTGGLGGILATGRAPAYAQGTALHWLGWADFGAGSVPLVRRRAGRLPQILVRGDRLQRRQVSGNLGRVPRRRQENEGQGSAVRPDRGPYFRRRAGLVVPLSVVVGRQGDRRRQEDRGAEQQG